MCSQTVLVDFGCWFRVAFGLVMGFVLCEFGGLMDSGFRVRILGFVWAGSGFRLVDNSGFRGIPGFGCWFRVSPGAVPGFAWAGIPGFAKLDKL